MGSHSMKSVLLITFIFPYLRGRPSLPSLPSPSLPSHPSQHCAELRPGGGLETGHWQLWGDISLVTRSTHSHNKVTVTTIQVYSGCDVTVILTDNNTEILHSSPCSGSYLDKIAVIDKHACSGVTQSHRGHHHQLLLCMIFSLFL